MNNATVSDTEVSFAASLSTKHAAVSGSVAAALRCERMGCEAKALRRSFPDEALTKYRRAGFGREFDEPIAMPNGRDAP